MSASKGRSQFPELIYNKGMLPASSRTPHSAFSMAELLLALLTIAVIATFTIPKILAANAATQRIAVFKETLATVHELIYTGYMSGGIRSAGRFSTYFSNNLNYIQRCQTPPNNCFAFTWAAINNTGEYDYELPNGAVISGVDNGTNAVSVDGYDRMFIDWNGLDGPNTEGDDVLGIQVCILTTGSCAYPGSPSEGYVRPGNLGPYRNNSSSNSRALYYEIYGD